MFLLLKLFGKIIKGAYQLYRAECEKFTVFPSSTQTCFNQMPLNKDQNLLAVKSSIEFFK